MTDVCCLSCCSEVLGKFGSFDVQYPECCHTASAFHASTLVGLQIFCSFSCNHGDARRKAMRQPGNMTKTLDRPPLVTERMDVGVSSSVTGHKKELRTHNHCG